ncbi:MAG: DNA-binding protein [Burkholderiales bacterium]|nr:DNA-binding protein [Burkholderiales bacterium]
MIESLLEKLEFPRSPDDLARELGTTGSVVEGMLELLESRGYVERLCQSSSSCGGCAVVKMCPIPVAGPQGLWRRIPRPESSS